MSSKDKLFFINYSLPANTRKGCKLVQLQLEQSLLKCPSCMQDGWFLVDFYILHPDKKATSVEDKRFWIKYHEKLNQKTIGEHYHIIKPSEVSPEQDKHKGLVPYCKWFEFSNLENILHSPFNFATKNNLTTRDLACVRYNNSNKFQPTSSPKNIQILEQSSDCSEFLKS